MPFREVSVMDERREFVGLVGRGDVNIRELCRRFGVSPATGYKWLERFRLEGDGGLAERSRRPRGSPRRTPAEVEERVLEIRAASNQAWGGRKIRRVLEREGMADPPAASTITAILRRHHALGVNGTAAGPAPWQRFERASPNELWQMDFKGHFALHAGRCHALTALDDHSRYNLILAALGEEREASVRAQLEGAFRRYGLPLAMLTDGGPPWRNPRGEPYTRFAVWLMRLGIRVLHGRPRHPQTQGKEERFHRTLKAELIEGRSFFDLVQCQHAFDAWRRRYNHERPHEALAMATPGERYRPSARAFPETLPPIEYAPGDEVRKVDGDGFISFKGRPWRVGKGFRGEIVALRPNGSDGVFDLHYCAHHVATIDLRQAEDCGLVDDASPRPQGPQQQQQLDPLS
jgi:transposase InsO family protein